MNLSTASAAEAFHYYFRVYFGFDFLGQNIFKTLMILKFTL